MSAVDLPDINVWLALADRDHEHHDRARNYWEKESASRLAFTRVSMLGLIRLLSNRHVMKGDPFTTAEAWSAYLAFRDLPEVFFLAEPESAESMMREWSEKPSCPASRLTDAWLASVAHTTRSRLVSFDADYKQFQGLAFLHLTVAKA
ncbi:MAG: TA system VapC family ribonuclease toxin [Chthoniobacterales bacterium]